MDVAFQDLLETLQHCLSALAHSIDGGCWQPHISQQIALVIGRSISRAPWWRHCPAIMWGQTSGCRRSVTGNHLGSVFLNARNSKSFVSGGISHPLDAGQLSSEIDLLPDGGRTETFAVSQAGWGLTAHSCLSWFP